MRFYYPLYIALRGMKLAVVAFQEEIKARWAPSAIGKRYSKLDGERKLLPGLSEFRHQDGSPPMRTTARQPPLKFRCLKPNKKISYAI